MRRQVTPKGKRELVLESLDDVKFENKPAFLAALVWLRGGDEEDERDVVFEIAPNGTKKDRVLQ